MNSGIARALNELASYSASFATTSSVFIGVMGRDLARRSVSKKKFFGSIFFFFALLLRSSISSINLLLFDSMNNVEEEDNDKQSTSMLGSAISGLCETSVTSVLSELVSLPNSNDTVATFHHCNRLVKRSTSTSTVLERDTPLKQSLKRKKSCGH